MNRFRERIGNGPPVVIAHRGDSAHAPENTLEAASKGYAAGAFAWELDVHLSRDGVPIVLHDESLMRTTDVAVRFAGDSRQDSGFRVAEFDLAEIQSLDAGSWFLQPRHRSAMMFGTFDSLPESDRRRFCSGAVRVPTLREALEFSVGLDWPVNVELKTFPEADPRLLGAVLELVDRMDSADLVLISSFDLGDVARAARWRPDVAVAALIDAPLFQAGRYIREVLKADYLHLSAAAMGSESQLYRRDPSSKNLRFGDEGDLCIPRLVYTVNDARVDGLAAHLAEVRVAGVFTDDPAALVGLWESSRKPGQQVAIGLPHS